MIPPEGRDVQCSNCTTTWFQPGLDQHETEAVDADQPIDIQDETTRPLEDIPTEAPRRTLDPEVRDVLREEAAREAALREQEGGPPEPQAAPAPARDEELEADPIEAAVSGVIAAAESSAELEDAPRDRARSEAAARFGGQAAGTGTSVDAQTAAADAARGASGSRRDLLPDIDEINSTLRATQDRNPGRAGGSDIGTVEGRPRRRSATRFGFGVALLVFAGAIAIYLNAPRIAAAVPQTGPVLQGYVAQVDRLRSWIDEMAQGALTSGGPEATAASPEADATSEPEPTVEVDAPTPDADAVLEEDTTAESEAPATDEGDSPIEVSEPEVARDDEVADDEAAVTDGSVADEEAATDSN